MATDDKDGGSGLMKVLREQAKARKKNVEQLDIKHEIGVTAGEIYKFLEGKGEVALKDVRKNVPLKGPMFAAALGWLLREGKISVRVLSGKVKVSLK